MLRDFGWSWAKGGIEFGLAHGLQRAEHRIPLRQECWQQFASVKILASAPLEHDRDFSCRVRRLTPRGREKARSIGCHVRSFGQDP